MFKDFHKNLVSGLAFGLFVSCQSQRLGVDTKEGIDISYHQGDIDWGQLTPDNSGKKFIIVKATEGETIEDPKFLEYWQSISDVGFETGAYHSVQFSFSRSAQQMENFLTQLRRTDALTNNSIIALDVLQSILIRSTNAVGEITEQCVTYLKDEANITPYLYTRTNFWNVYVPITPAIVKECPLWIARFRNQEPSPEELPNGWHKWAIWKYSVGKVPGVPETFINLDRMKLTPEA